MEYYVTKSEAAALLGVSEPCISHYIKTHRLSAEVILSRLAFKRSDVERLKVERGTGFKVGRPRGRKKPENGG
jgi:predicted transcriptional regulator